MHIVLVFSRLIHVAQNVSSRPDEASGELTHLLVTAVSETLQNMPPDNIINYDETNLSDDPWHKKVIMKRGVKHRERIMNSSKSAASIMYAGTPKKGSFCVPTLFTRQRNCALLAQTMV